MTSKRWRRTFRRTWYRILLGFVTGCFLLIGVATAATEDKDSYYEPDSAFIIGSRIGYGIVALISFVLLVRIVRLGIFVNEDGVLVRNLFRTPFVAWPEIARFGRPAGYGLWRKTGLTVVRIDGTAVYAWLYSPGPFNGPNFARSVIEELESLRPQNLDGMTMPSR